MVELMTSFILNYHCDLLKSGFIHDPDSNDWKNPKKYQEGEKFSVALQVFSFHIQSMLIQLCKIWFIICNMHYMLIL